MKMHPRAPGMWPVVKKPLAKRKAAEEEKAAEAVQRSLQLNRERAERALEQAFVAEDQKIIIALRCQSDVWKSLALEAYRSLVKKGEEQVNKAKEYIDGLEKKFEERIKSQFCLMSIPEVSQSSR